MQFVDLSSAIKASVSVITMLIVSSSVLIAQEPSIRTVPFKLDPRSSITVNGTSTVNSFSCTSENIEGSGSVTRDQDAIGVANISVQIETEVENFDCRNWRMTKDLWKALKSKDHPRIFYELDTTPIEPSADLGKEVFQINASGRLIIAGSERQIEVLLTATRASESAFDLTGTQEILMTDFGVEPPTALFGLVKANDQIIIHFDLKPAVTPSQ